MLSFTSGHVGTHVDLSPCYMKMQKLLSLETLQFALVSKCYEVGEIKGDYVGKVWDGKKYTPERDHFEDDYNGS